MRIAKESELPVPRLGSTMLEQLMRLPLKGNVRELENLLHRAVALCEGDELQLEDLQLPHSGFSPLFENSATTTTTATTHTQTQPTDLISHFDAQERTILVKTLRETGFDDTLAATQLGLSLRQMRYRMARLKIEPPVGFPFTASDAGHAI